MQEGMSRESTRTAAYANLNMLAEAVFYSCKRPEEADFIADLATDIEGIVAAKVSHLRSGSAVTWMLTSCMPS